MYNSYVTSTYTIKCKGPLSSSFNDYCISCLNEKFYRNPLFYSTYQCCNCCNCGRNVVQNKGGFHYPSYSNGLKQSALIECLPHKRVILNGFDRFYGNRFPGYVVGRSCYGDLYERKVCDERRWKSGKGKFSCRASEEERERQRLCDGGEGFDEVETLISLLSEDFSVGERKTKSIQKIHVDDECKSYRSWKRRVDDCAMEVSSKFELETRRRREPLVGNEIRSVWSKEKEKKVDGGVMGIASKLEYESKKMKSREGNMRKKENEKRVVVSKVPTERETLNFGLKNEESDNQLRQKSRANHLKEEREHHLLGENRKTRIRKEESEILSRHEDQFQKTKKDISSCSSYYSISSGEFESDDEINNQLDQRKSADEINIQFDQRKSKLNRDDKQEFERHGQFSKESELVLRKEDNLHTRLSGGVESSWRKETEKKLTDTSIKEAESSKDSSINKSKYNREHEESHSKIDFGSNSKLDHRMSEARTKHKHFKDTSEAFGADYENNTSSYQKVYNNRDESSSKRISSAQDVTKHQELLKTNDSIVEEIDSRGVSSNYRQSETRLMNMADHSSRNFYDRNEKQQQSVHYNEYVESRLKHERIIEDSSLERISVSHEETDRRSRKQGEKSSFIYDSSLETAEPQLEARIEQSTKPSQEITKMSVPLHIETHISIASSSSQPEARGSSDVKPPRGVEIEEITDTITIPQLGQQSLELVKDPQESTKKNETDKMTLKLISIGDALGSADRLQKSSEHHVDEFLEKAKNEISSSKVKEKHEISAIVSHGPGVSRRSSLRSRSKCPSDETWHVNDPSTERPLEEEDEEALVHEGTSQNIVVKRSGKSLWNHIGDIVRFRWARHDDHGISSKSGRKTSPNLSTRSETYFSGHDTEVSNVSPIKNDTITSISGSVSIEQQKLVEISSEVKQHGDIFPISSVNLPKDNTNMSSSSGSTVNPKAEETQSSNPSSSLQIRRFSPSIDQITSASESSERISRPVSTGSSDKDSETNLPKDNTNMLSSSGSTINPKAEETQSSNPLSSLQIRRSPAVDQITSVSESSERISRPASTGSSDKDSETKQRKLLRRTDQVVKDRFEEWEEAYRLESEQQKLDETFMREALIEAKKAADIWEVPVGAVLVHGGKIIARGYNLVEDLRDSTAHAEMMCIREASNILRSWRLSDTTLYVTLEPCAMCAGAILQARIDTLVWGAPNKLLGADGSWIRLLPNVEGASGSESSDKPSAPPVHPFHPKMVIRRGVLASECSDAMQQFFQRRRKKEKKPEASTPQHSRLPISQHPSKFLSKMHHAFHIMFCL